MNPGRVKPETGQCRIYRRGLFAGLMLLTVAAAPGWVAEPATGIASGSIEIAFDAIQTAWSQEDAKALVAHFGDRKVLLRLPGSQAEARRFSHQQCFLILRDHFASHEIREFEFVRIKSPETERGVAVGLAESTWRKRGVGRFKAGRVLVALVQEESRWVITEIQALR